MRIAIFVASLLALLLLLPEGSMAQGMGEAIARQNLRGYTHMFIAYGIAWLLVLGWAIAIFRRLGRIEDALRD